MVAEPESGLAPAKGGWRAELEDGALPRTPERHRPENKPRQRSLGRPCVVQYRCLSETMAPMEIRLEIQGHILRQTLPTRTSHITFPGVSLLSGPTRLDPGCEKIARTRVLDVTVTRIGEK
jgi:hypothetical protein